LPSGKLLVRHKIGWSQMSCETNWQSKALASTTPRKVPSGTEF